MLNGQDHLRTVSGTAIVKMTLMDAEALVASWFVFDPEAIEIDGVGIIEAAKPVQRVALN